MVITLNLNKPFRDLNDNPIPSNKTVGQVLAENLASSQGLPGVDLLRQYSLINQLHRNQELQVTEGELKGLLQLQEQGPGPVLVRAQTGIFLLHALTVVAAKAGVRKDTLPFLSRSSLLTARR